MHEAGTCSVCAEVVSSSNPLFHCGSSRHNYCHESESEDQSPCLICVPQGASAAGPETSESELQLPDLPDFSQVPATNETESGEKSILLSQYKNGVHVSKMGCKFSKYGCRKNVKCHLYEKHIQKCQYRPYSCPGCTVYVPPVEDSLAQSVHNDAEHNLKLSTSSDGSEGTEFNPLNEGSSTDANLKSKSSAETAGRQYLLGDADPWLWTASRLPTQHDSNLLLQKELRQLNASKSKKPEYMQNLSQRLVQVCEELVNSL